MKTQIDILSRAMESAFLGEPAPSFMGQEFSEIMGAARLMTASPESDQATRNALAQIGLHAIRLTSSRLVASMHSERALAIMRDNQEPLC